MIYTVLDVAAIIFEMIITFMFYGYFLKRKYNGLFNKGISAILFFVLVVMNNHFVSSRVAMGIVTVLIYFIASCFFSGTIRKRFFLTIGYMTIILISEIIALLIMLIGKATVTTVLDDNNVQRILGTVISKIIVLWIIKIVSIFSNKDERKLYLNYWLALLTIPIVNLIFLFVFVSFVYDIERNLSVPVLLAIAAIMYTTLLVFYLFDKIISLSGDNPLLGEQIHNQADYSKIEAEQAENIKSIKHDFINHLQVLYKMLYYNEPQNAKQYLIDLNVIKDVEDNSINTGNISLDTVLSSKIHIAKNKGIKVSTNIIVPENLPMDSIDECIIFGNLLDNAIEACDKINNKEKKIDVSVKYNGKYLLCNIENPTANKIKYGKNSLVTTKGNKNEHGIGTKNINRIVKKYNGTIKYFVKDEKFNAELMLFLD